MTLNLTIIGLLYVLLAVAIGYYAMKKNRNAYIWGGLALVPGLNAPLLLVLFFLSPAPTGETLNEQ